MTSVFIQHGDFHEAFGRLMQGGAETYRDQRLSVEYVHQLSERTPVTVVSLCGVDYDHQVSPDLRLLGMAPARFDNARIAALFHETGVTRLVTRTPLFPILQEATRLQIPTLPCLADLFSPIGSSPKRWFRMRRMRRLLTGPTIPCVANHSLNASRSLIDVVGLSKDFVVPWDWSRLTPSDTAKTGSNTPIRVFYAGAFKPEKGLGDVIEAIGRLSARGVAAELSLAGGGDPAPWEKLAATHGAPCRFLGLIPHADVRAQMAAHDLVIVPSRHTYPEGLPNTIYEGLASRTPLIISDHPAFAGRIKEGEGCVTFPAGDVAALAETIAKLGQDAALYARLSEAGPEALAGLYVGAQWTDLIDCFLNDPGNDGGWVAARSMTGLGIR